MPVPIFMKLGMYIMPHEAISTTYFIQVNWKIREMVGGKDQYGRWNAVAKDWLALVLISLNLTVLLL
jgi:hypothetical protein